MNSDTSRVSQAGPIAWMARNGVSANLLMLVMVLGGFMASWQIKKEVFPEFSLDQVEVTVAYPGASPADVEQGVVLVVEEALQGIEGVDEIQSTANEGSARIVAQLQESADPNRAFTDIQQAVSRINTFPLDAEQPNIALAKRIRSVMKLQLYGEADPLALRDLGEQVRDQLLTAPGITQVELEGVRDYRIHVEVPAAQLQAHGLTLGDVAQRLSSAALESGAGSVETAAGEVLVRVSERRDWADEFADLSLTQRSDGSTVRLADIATVRDGLDDTIDGRAWFDGHPAIGLEVFRIGDQTPTGVSEAVNAALDEIRATLPGPIELRVLSDDSKVYQQRLDLMLKNAFLGLLLVFALMTLFMEFKLAFWVTMGIPIAFLGAMLLMPATGISINMIAMFAFIISLGIVVDDAVVIGESIYEHRERGMPLLDAAIAGARELAVPVTFSVLTNIVAFLPLMFVPGTMGKLFVVIPSVVCTVFAISLIEALLILPAHLAGSQPGRGDSRLARWQQRFNQGFARFVEQVYQPLLQRAVAHRYLSLSIGVGLLVVMLAFAASGRMGFEMMPSVDADLSQATLVMPVDHPASEVEAAARALEASAREVVAAGGGAQLSDGIFTVIRDNSVQVRVFLTAPEVRPISTAELTRRWRAATPPIPAAQSLRFAADAGGPGSGPALTIELSHRQEAVLDQASAQLAAALAEFPTASDIDDGFAPGKLQFNVRMTDAGRSLGLTARDVSQQIRAAFFGAEVLRQQRGRNEVRVQVRLPENERRAVSDIHQLLIRTPAGSYVPLNLIAELSTGQAASSITRRQGRRTVQVTANVTPRQEAGQILRSMQADVLPQLLKDFPGLSYNLEGRQADQRDSLAALGLGFVTAVGLIYLLLAVPFSSYLQPVIVMAAIPFGIFGAIIGHLIMGYSMSIISMMGVIALSGVVVNDSLVMVHNANQRRAEGLSAAVAVVQAGVRRFRPILLTTISTFGGLAPMIFETSRQARFMIPMAISLGYGILFATAITLILVPCLYLIIEDLRGLLGRRSAAHVQGQPAHEL